MAKLRVLVLCGGPSAEHEVSLVSAKHVIENLDARRYAPELIFIDKKGRWFKAAAEKLVGKVQLKGHRLVEAGARPLSPSEVLKDPKLAVFPVLHGPYGEDGTIQGFLELSGVAYVGCGVLGSALGMDKEMTKRLAREAKLPVLAYAVARTPAAAERAAAALGFPLFIKPARLGSSVGISKVTHAVEVATAAKAALQYDDKILLEKAIPAREIECAVLGDPHSEDPEDPLRLTASICGEIIPRDEFYSYKAKYLDPQGAQLLVPAAIDSGTMARLRELSLSAFRALDGYGMARVDFLLDKNTGQPYFNELNTIPGFTPISMYPRLWRESGIDSSELLARLIELALRRRKARARLKTSI